ncbi:hypothetical protein EA187_14325 [Lujinxingia sediminis]|uniref:Uncharacterized protein n=1 Tax=Lujinxingia sediminis TaxID=2480984 RepID=A0ABY0CR65_9DELT|nr:hypothetical protein [Lujinxingia sediminis]RVU43007.1 hypothetical protein EA187_14325 [Lujinxingia sediminis]
MLDPRELQRGHWVGSMLSFTGALLKSPAFWLSWALMLAPGFIWPVASTSTSSAPLTDAEVYTALVNLSAFVGLFFVAPFFIFRRMNAELMRRRELQQPLHVNLELVTGSEYTFELEVADLVPRLEERAAARDSLRRKIRMVERKNEGARGAAAEANEDLLAHYRTDLKRKEAELDAIARRYHAPDVELRFRMRVTNPDPYRVARVLEMLAELDGISDTWELTRVGAFELDGDRVTFPLNLAPGESFVGTLRYMMKPPAGMDQPDYATLIKHIEAKSISTLVAVHVDDTYDDIAVTYEVIPVSMRPLGDALRLHWKKSVYLGGQGAS